MLNQEEIIAHINVIKNKVMQLNIDTALKEYTCSLLDKLFEPGKKIYITKEFQCEEYLAVTNGQLRVHVRNYGSDGVLQQKGSYVITSKDLPFYIAQHKDTIDNEIESTMRRR